MGISFNEEKLIERNELVNFVPHKGKMFLLSRITDYSVDEKWICSQTDVKDAAIFYDEALDGIPSWCTFEIMAQTVASFASIEGRMKGSNTKPKPGVVLSVSKFNAKVASFSAGATISMKISEDSRDDAVIKYYCELFAGKDDEEPCVSTFITVMEMEEMKTE